MFWNIQSSGSSKIKAIASFYRVLLADVRVPTHSAHSFLTSQWHHPTADWHFPVFVDFRHLARHTYNRGHAALVLNDMVVLFHWRPICTHKSLDCYCLSAGCLPWLTALLDVQLMLNVKCLRFYWDTHVICLRLILPIRFWSKILWFFLSACLLCFPLIWQGTRLLKQEFPPSLPIVEKFCCSLYNNLISTPPPPFTLFIIISTRVLSSIRCAVIFLSPFLVSSPPLLSFPFPLKHQPLADSKPIASLYTIVSAAKWLS